MRLFRCQICGEVLYFENLRCPRCRHRLGFLPDLGLLSVLEREDEVELLATLAAAGGEPDPEMLPGRAGKAEIWVALIRPDRRYRLCANAEFEACNWLVPDPSGERFCAACRHNRTVPAMAPPRNLERWRKLELAKHRLFYSLLRLQLPLATRAEDPEGLVFDFLADPANPKGHAVMTGHASGLITIALREADDAEREQVRNAMGEPYRTLLGHFRHETGHYYWDRLVRDQGRLDAFRAVFGDERRHYGDALKAHYARGAPKDWRDGFVSAYASAHPWEDFAETWAHYLHIVDTLETASAFGVGVHPRHDTSGRLHVDIDFDAYREDAFERLTQAWLPLVIAVNSLNRSMGQPDLYPFSLGPRVAGKLRFIHELVRGCRPGAAGRAGRPASDQAAEPRPA